MLSRSSPKLRYVVIHTQEMQFLLHVNHLLRDFLAFGDFVSLQKSLREVQQILNSTEGNFHQLVALLNCRGLNKVMQGAGQSI